MYNQQSTLNETVLHHLAETCTDNLSVCGNISEKNVELVLIRRTVLLYFRT